LHIERHVADLVEEQRAAAGATDDAGEMLGRSGERAPAMPEQLRIEHVLRSRRAVEGDEKPLCTVGIPVNGFR
jgi:hypothetical protein